MPQVGQTATGPNGQKAVWDGRQWIEQASAPQGPPVDPTFQYQGPKAQADVQNVQLRNQGQQIDNRNAAAQAPYVGQSAQADAAKASAEARRAEVELEKAKLDIQQGKDPEAAVRAARSILRILDGEGGIQSQYDENLDGTNIFEYLPTSKMRQFDADAGFLKPASKKLFRAKGEGSQSDAEGRDYDALVPNSWNSDEANKSTISNLRAEAEATLTEYGEAIPRRGSALPPQAGGNVNPAMQSAEGEGYSTPEDMEIAAAVRKAYMNGGTIADMAQASKDAGRAPTLDVMRGFADLVEYRDRTGKYKGQNTQPTGGSIVPAKSGSRNLASQALGDMAASPLGTFGIAAGNAASVGGLDEIAGGINSLATGRDYETERDVADFGKQASYSENPMSALFGEIVGAGGLGGMAAKAAPNAARAMVANGRRSAATGAGFGSVNGALENNDDRMTGAGVGALLGAGGGLFGNKVAAPAIEKMASSQTAQSLSTKLRGGINALRPDTVKPSALPQVSASERMAYDNIDDIGAVRANLDEAQGLGLPYSLADASPKLRSLAGSVSRRSQDARQLAEEVFEPRALDQGARAQAGIAENFAQPVDPKLRGQELTAAGSTEAAPFYNMANNRAAPINDNIDAYLKTETGREALNKAKRLAENEGRDPLAMGFDLDAQGNVTLSQKPSFETLDYTKRGIDDQIYAPSNMNVMTGELMDKSPAVRSLQKFSSNFVGELDKINPAYPQARATYAPYAKAKEALMLGTKGPSNRVKPRDLERMTDGMPEMSLEEYRRGYATNLADQVDETKNVSDPYKRIFGSTSQQQKAGQLFPEGAERFGRLVAKENDMSATRYETLGGSPTAQRMAADEQFGNKALEMGTDMAMDVAGGGGAVSAARMLPNVAQWGRDAAKLGMGNAAEKRATNLAPVLFNTDHTATTASLDQIEQYLLARNARKESARRIGGLFGATSPIVIQ